MKVITFVSIFQINSSRLLSRHVGMWIGGVLSAQNVVVFYLGDGDLTPSLPSLGVADENLVFLWGVHQIMWLQIAKACAVPNTTERGQAEGAGPLHGRSWVANSQPGPPWTHPPPLFEGSTLRKGLKYA